MKQSPSIQDLEFCHPDGSLGQVDVLKVSDVRKGQYPISIYAPTRLDFHAIQFVTARQGTHTVDFESIPLNRGDVLYIRPGQIHAFDQTSRHEAWFLLFRQEVLPNPESLTAFDPRRPLIQPESADFKLLIDLVTSLDSVTRRRPSFNVQKLAPWLLAAITTTLGEVAANPIQINLSLRSQHLKLVFEYERLLDQHCSLNHGVDWYASQLATTTRSLSRACKSVRDRTPKQLMSARVVLEAKKQLILSEDSVATISHDLGYSEATNFVKFFRRNSGVTPVEFRVRNTVGS